ncbi:MULTISPECIES: nitrilase-related carbon-nitrogen hydrolase [Methanosarcina]|uniref:Carbon-nitrogen hydrolase n=1 Tax=Methanosarcina vacuolata Z-761 TaxID=1434123 RepID=A0A0E3Q4J4_9EURY|nr:MULTISPECIES: nitrilase-related carbon-nitrogen hydrolase [Methanosarcina]AKB43465.1 Carbon-nitrogen hydrolase [Methanosarcina vacuolata Z-761]AKB46925.1 Carbon-nitrogen hydrolase [Methanosarcina sp. Kolksee]
MKVACIQMDVLQCRKQENLEKALHMALKAVRKGAELIVLPEVFSTGFCYEYLDHAAETLPSPLLENLACFSEANDCIIMGSVIEKVASEETSNSGTPADFENSTLSDSSNSPFYYNLGFCFESGTLAGSYRKTHPFKNENNYFSKGDSIEPISLKKQNLKIGFEICYELRFPEVARKLSLAGSDLLVTTAAFPNPRSEHWNILAKARAIENQIPHIACNRIGSAPDCSYFGNSMIIDAWGEVKADAGNKECVIVHDLDLSRKNEVRKMIPVFENRRIELYSEDLKII